MIDMLSGWPLTRIVIIRDEMGVHSKTDPIVFLLTINPTPLTCKCCSPLNHTLCPSSVINSPQPVYRVSASPMIFHVYRCNSCSSSFIFPVLYRVRTFHVPIVKSVLQILILLFWFWFFPGAYFSILSWKTRENAVVFMLGPDRSRMWFPFGLRMISV